MARVSKEKAVKRLRKLLEDVSEVYLEGEHSQKYTKWILDVDRAFYRIFGEGSREYEQIPDTHRGEPQDYLDFLVSLVESLSAKVRETRSTQRIRVGRRQRKRTCWDCEREWKRMVVPLEPGRPSEARQLLRTRR